MKTIILTGGGTAGHCIPNLVLIPYLQKYFDKIVYIGSKNGIEKNLVKQYNLDYYEIECSKLYRDKITKNIAIPFKVITGFSQANKIIKQLRPNIIFSKGGYVALPVIFAGKKQGIPIISHESDFSLGLANKIASRYSKHTLTTFKETALKTKNGIHVGTPLRKNTDKIDNDFIKKLNFSPNKPIILVTGGSQGSKAINDCIQKALPQILNNYCVLHQCGKNNLNDIKQKDYYQCEFIQNMQSVYPHVALCISRAGSNTMFELLSKKIPTIFIPLPKGASRGDQELNANYFNKKGLCNVILQENLNPQSLVDCINKTYITKSILQNAMAKENIKDCSEKIVEIICKNAL